jgi:hypothetical protein
MERPPATDERGREKWCAQPCVVRERTADQSRDAWRSSAGLSRTEAKRRYVTLLLETMRRYASSAADSRELVDELEFVWDQVKTNVSPGSSGSSPMHNSHIIPTTAASNPSAAPAAPLSSSPPARTGLPARVATPTPSPAPFTFVPPPSAGAAAVRLRNPKRASAPARTVSPTDLRALASSPALSTSDGYGAGDDLDLEDDPDDGGDEFVDAPDGSETPAAGLEASRMLFSSDEEGDGGGGQLPGAVARALDPRGARIVANPSSAVATAVRRDAPAKPSADADGPEDGAAAAAARADEKFARWRRRVSAALIKLTAEVAALREQLAASAASPYSRAGAARAAGRAAAFLAKVLAVDALLLLALLAWMRWWGRGGRVEGAFRVLVGDAVAQAVKRVGTGVERSVARVGRAVMGQGRRDGGGS